LAASLKTVIHRLPITRARINLGQVARRAHLNKEYFILEKDGIPIAAIMDVDALEDYLELQDPALKMQVRKSYEEYRRGRARGADTFLAELRGKTAKRKK